MELSPSWESTSCAATQEFPNILWNRKVHYCVHKSPPLVLTQSQIKPVHTMPSYLRSILILFSHLCLSLPSDLFPYGFPTNILYAFSFSPMLATFPVHLILFDLIIVIILHPSLVQIFTLSPCSQTRSVCVHNLIAGTRFYTHTKLQENL
jgi:hypothetical protein